MQADGAWRELRAWRELPKEVIDLLDYVFVHRPARVPFERLVLRNRTDGLNSMKSLRRLFARVCGSLDYEKRAFSLIAGGVWQIIPVCGLEEVLQRWYGCPKIAKLLEAERQSRAWRTSVEGWVPDPVASAYGARHPPHLGSDTIEAAAQFSFFM